MLWLHALSHLPVYWDFFLELHKTQTSSRSHISSLSFIRVKLSTSVPDFSLVLHLELDVKWEVATHFSWTNVLIGSAHINTPALLLAHNHKLCWYSAHCSYNPLGWGKSPENKSHQCLCNIFLFWKVIWMKHCQLSVTLLHLLFWLARWNQA